MRIILICNRITCTLGFVTMERVIMSTETVAKRAAVGVAILAAHLGLVLLLAASGFVVPTLVQSVTVSFIQPEAKEPDRPAFHEAALRSIDQVPIPPPEIVVPVDPTNPPPIAATTEETQMPAPPSPSDAATSTSGGALPEISDVAYVVQPAPRYPPESRRIREHGLVLLRVLIDEQGHAKTIEVYRSSGHPRLDEAARAAVLRAIFKPFIDRGGVARAAAAIVPIEFSLRSSLS
jgi:protein TonB